MYQLEINDLTKLQVHSRKFEFNYATDGSMANPLEATFAALAGCAGVYSIKACKKINKSPLGIKISGRSMTKLENPSVMNKWVTTVHFPEGWSDQEKQLVLDEIQKCAVKELIHHGPEIEFITQEEAKATEVNI